MKLIETPYGKKRPEFLCKAMDAYEREREVLRALRPLVAIVNGARVRKSARFAYLAAARAVIAEAVAARGEE